MKFIATIIAAVLCVFLLSCKDSAKGKTIDPSETRSTLENNQNTWDTISEERTNSEDFKGGGGEPFWSIEINFDVIEFTTPEKKISAPSPNPKISGDSTSIDSSFDGGTIQVRLTKEACEDGMSGKNYSHKVEVQIKGKSNKNVQAYTGCGSYNNPQ